jgi:hypothetical protein
MSRKPRADLPREVFLSHASKDRRIASRIGSILRAHGVPVWYSETNLIGAQQWHDEIGEALARCDWFLIVLSPQATRSKWVKRELLYALRSSHMKISSCRFNTASATSHCCPGLSKTSKLSISCRILTAAAGRFCELGDWVSRRSRDSKLKGNKNSHDFA